MTEYRRRTPVQAFQWDGSHEPESYPDWFHDSMGDNLAGESSHDGENRLWLARDQFGAVFYANPGDWIVQDHEQFLMAYLPEAFERSFVPLSQE